MSNKSIFEKHPKIVQRELIDLIRATWDYPEEDWTPAIVAAMMRFSTGTHFLDSGGVYGRHWQRNQLIPVNAWEKSDVASVQFNVWRLDSHWEERWFRPDEIPVGWERIPDNPNRNIELEMRSSRGNVPTEPEYVLARKWEPESLDWGVDATLNVYHFLTGYLSYNLPWNRFFYNVWMPYADGVEGYIKLDRPHAKQVHYFHSEVTVPISFGKPTITVYEEPDEGSKVLYTLHTKTTFGLLEHEEGEVWAKISTNPDGTEVSWFELADGFRDFVIKLGGDFYSGSGEYTVNTYNHTSLLSQVIQYSVVNAVPPKQYRSLEEARLVILQLHNGADVRGGYTAPVLFEFASPFQEDLDDQQVTIGCTRCYAGWGIYDGYNVESNDRGMNISRAGDYGHWIKPMPEVKEVRAIEIDDFRRNAITRILRKWRPAHNPAQMAFLELPRHFFHRDWMIRRIFRIGRWSFFRQLHPTLFVDSDDQAFCPVCYTGRLIADRSYD